MIEERRSPAEMSDHELLAAYEETDAKAGTDPTVEALLAEIERRNLDI